MISIYSSEFSSTSFPYQGNTNKFSSVWNYLFLCFWGHCFFLCCIPFLSLKWGNVSYVICAFHFLLLKKTAQRSDNCAKLNLDVTVSKRQLSLWTPSCHLNRFWWLRKEHLRYRTLYLLMHRKAMRFLLIRRFHVSTTNFCC